MIHSKSLSQTVDAVNDAFFFGRSIAVADRDATAEWIARRHAVAGTYGRLFGLFDGERRNGIRLFTGERITNAAARHIAGEEACRALLLLRSKNKAAGAALRGATADMIRRLGPADASGPKPDDGQQHRFWAYRGGTYCCGPCSAGVWRHITAGGMDDAERRLTRGLICLKTYRKGDGTWRTFPFWYTVSALIEMDLKAASDELRYAAGPCERVLRRQPMDRYAERRAEVARRVLARV